MGQQFSIKYTKKFVEDTNSIVNYIKNELSAPKASSSLIKSLYKTASNIKTMPLAYKKIKHSNTQLQKIRTANVKNFTIYFKLVNDIIYLLRLVYSKRDQTKVDV